MAGMILASMATATLATTAYIKLWKFKYWSKIGLAYIEPSLPFAFANQLLFSTWSKEIQTVYQEFKTKGLRHGGIYVYTSPVYVPLDPVIIKAILASTKFASSSNLQEFQPLEDVVEEFKEFFQKLQGSCQLSVVLDELNKTGLVEKFLTEATWKCLKTLLENQHVLQLLELELREVSSDITAETLDGLNYLEITLKETLRMHPPLPIIRKTTNDLYVIPQSTVHLEKDMKVIIPTISLHYDPDFYSGPNDFQPDRFRDKTIGDVPYLPLGDIQEDTARELTRKMKMVVFLVLTKFNLSYDEACKDVVLIRNKHI